MNGYYDKTMYSFSFCDKKTGVSQTASVRSPYIYAEDNWMDDMELAAACYSYDTERFRMEQVHMDFISPMAVNYAKKEPDHSLAWGLIQQNIINGIHLSTSGIMNWRNN